MATGSGVFFRGPPGVKGKVLEVVGDMAHLRGAARGEGSTAVRARVTAARATADLEGSSGSRSMC
jgi:hypothetical protein